MKKSFQLSAFFLEELIAMSAKIALKKLCVGLSFTQKLVAIQTVRK